jgi:DNA repair protein RecO (recombination protein O)
MRQFRTKGIILNRTDYGEADRIITFLTPDNGKVRAIAKGVRKSKSKLAGGIELFSVSDISFIPGKREISTVVSTRLLIHYGEIVKDIDRTNAGYGFIKKLDKATEEAADESYFNLLNESFKALDNSDVDLGLIMVWFEAQLLRLAGHTPNLRTDHRGEKLNPDDKFNFNFDNMAFEPNPSGSFSRDHIKFLRLMFSDNHPEALAKVKGSSSLTGAVASPVQSMLQLYIHL